MPAVGDRRRQMSSRSESPASGILQDRLLFEAEGHARAYGEDGFSQCEDVILHRGHVVVVLALIKRQQFLELLHVANFLGGTGSAQCSRRNRFWNRRSHETKMVSQYSHLSAPDRILGRIQ